MSKISTKYKEKSFRMIGDHQKFISRIKKTLYYGKLPKSDRFSLPVTELTAELFSGARNGHSLERLHLSEAASITRNACVSPCSLILALLYLERLKACNQDYLQRVAISELFLISLRHMFRLSTVNSKMPKCETCVVTTSKMVSSKFLYDDGEEDEVFMDEWAMSGSLSSKELVQLERDFLKAIEWKVYVDEVTFWERFQTFEIALAKKEGLTRGWFTYTELDILSNNIDIQRLLQIMITCITVLTTAYAAGLFTIMGSMMLVSNIPGNCLQARHTETNLDSFKSYLNVPQNTQYKLELNKENNTLMFSNSDYELDEMIYKKQLDAVDVLKTSIILASIKSLPQTGNRSCNTTFDFEDSEKDNVEYITWNWWNCPTMNWLTETSKLIVNFEFLPIHTYKHHYVEACNMNYKKLDLEDQIHRATKVRIQDQLENSWHKEWTDTIQSNFRDYNMLSYFQIFQKS